MKHRKRTYDYSTRSCLATHHRQYLNLRMAKHEVLTNSAQRAWFVHAQKATINVVLVPERGHVESPFWLLPLQVFDGYCMSRKLEETDLDNAESFSHQHLHKSHGSCLSFWILKRIMTAMRERVKVHCGLGTHAQYRQNCGGVSAATVELTWDPWPHLSCVLLH